jgi:hypothetical protein
MQVETHPAGTTALARLMPCAGLVEVRGIDVAAEPARAWERARHGDLADSAAIRALFALRSLPRRRDGAREAPSIRIDDLGPSPGAPGFGVLIDDPPREVVVGAIGQVWRPDIPFVYVEDAEAFARFACPGFVRVAWAVQVAPRASGGSRVEVELRVDATDPASWRRFRAYFALIGPWSRLIRRLLLDGLERELGPAPVPGDELLPDARAQATHAVTVDAPTERVWPWLAQMGRGRAGFYAIDLLDNGGARSARELHPDLGTLRAGDVIPADARGAGFEVLAADPGHALVLGGLYDARAGRQLPFRAPRPDRYWHVTWAFALEPLPGDRTRLVARARAAHPPSGRLHVAWARPVHAVMQRVQLRNIARRAEGRLPATDWRDALAGAAGAGVMAAAAATPFLRARRGAWTDGGAKDDGPFPGDALIPEPRWGWTHAIEVAAPADEVWPWVAQIGADRGGFYSYASLENLVGCGVRDAERIHPEWQARVGDRLILHPSAPSMTVVGAEPGRHLILHAAPDEPARAGGRPWGAATWLLQTEPLGPGRTRLVSRYRWAGSDDARTRLTMGPALLEPIGFAMDRRMLRGIRDRAERRAGAVAVDDA